MAAASDFFDEAQITVVSGKGGDGSVHFRREKYVPLGGPDGGDGGDGGSVVLESDPTLNTLHSFRFKRRFEAGSGSPGSANRRHGKKAADVVVRVPVGTVVHDPLTGEVISDLSPADASFVAARGGMGGLGNSHFATSTRQAPDFAEKGQPGEERSLLLELKLVADAGLVGLPNAGKSTLLASMSAARPKIAEYPFTTLSPNLGVVAVDDYSFVLADIPGLIEGAHEGVGLGDRFLRHIERTRLLIRVVDGSSSHAMADFDQVTRELKLYDPSLLEKPQIAVLTKMDLPDAQARAPTSAKRLSARGMDVLTASGVTHAGMMALITAIRDHLERLGVREESQKSEEEFVYTARPDPDHFTVERKRGTYTVRGRTVERVVSMTDMESAGAIARLQGRLRRLGVFQALEREGIRVGNRVRIGDHELTWEGELEEGLTTPAARTVSESPRRSRQGTRASRGRRRG
jgi:GTP-binding protein